MKKHEEVKELTIEEVKAEMKKYTDLFGHSLLEASLISKAETLEELAKIIERHHDHIGDCANDAQCSLLRFKERIGLGFYSTSSK